MVISSHVDEEQVPGDVLLFEAFDLYVPRIETKRVQKNLIVIQ